MRYHYFNNLQSDSALIYCNPISFLFMLYFFILF